MSGGVVSGHAKLSPSGAYRWMRCPGSVRLCEGLESPDSAASLEGTFAHAVAAHALEFGVEPSADIQVVDGTHTVTPEMVEHLKVYTDHVRTVLMLGGGTLHVEVPVALQLPDSVLPVHGTADAVVIQNGELHVIDLKFGAGKFVEVLNNEQLRIYALAVLDTMAEQAKAANVERITTTIVQPRNTGLDGEAVRSATYTLDELQTWRSKFLLPAVVAASIGNALCRPGDWCEWCPGSAKCHAFAARALEVAREVFQPIPATAVAAPVLAPATPPEPSALPVESIASVLQHAHLFETWVKAVREEALRRAEAGVEIPGFKLADKWGNRVWTDEEQARAMLEGFGIDPYAPREVVSPAQAEKRLGKGGKDLVAQLTTRPLRGRELVSADAKPRPSRADVFTKLDGGK